MLEIIIDISKNSNCKIENGTLYCNDYIVSDYQNIYLLEEGGLLEHTLNNVGNGNVINLALTLAKLHQFGFYENANAFLSRNTYEINKEHYFIYDLDCRESDGNDFIKNHSIIIGFINAVEQISKHSYQDADIKNLILFKEDKSAFLPINYSVETINFLKNIEKLKEVIETLVGNNTEKKLLYINELIGIINSQNEDDRFSSLILNIDAYYEKCNNSYQFYLSDFSANKLKLEIDSKALEYTQKIQGVINDAQTKLIAIPTAFVLVFTVLDFTDPISIKNIGTILSVFIFAVLIQLFLNNQRSALNFIEQNIKSYKEIFDKTKIEKISEKFNLVGEELEKQKKRLLITKVILWAFPILLVCGWLYLAYSNLLPSVGFFVLSSAMFILPYFIKPKIN